MNARLLTTVFLLCSLVVAKTVMQPKLRELAIANGESERLAMSMANTNKGLTFVGKFAEKPATNQSIDKVAIQAMSRLHHTHHDFGVVMTDVSAGNIVGGQNVITMQSLQGQNAATGLMSQEISIKGSYESLEEFQGFIQSQIIDHGGSISSIKMRGYSFDMKVQLFGRVEDQKAGV
jgi:hypothetical protein